VIQGCLRRGKAKFPKMEVLGDGSPVKTGGGSLSKITIAEINCGNMVIF
jgi:hypothetical protein